jgi:ribose 5-phosphate isomerase RpiB
MSLNRTDILAIKSDLAAATVRRNAEIQNILSLTAELREARRIATQLEKTLSQRFQAQRDAGKVDVFEELAKQGA